MMIMMIMTVQGARRDDRVVDHNSTIKHNQFAVRGSHIPLLLRRRAGLALDVMKFSLCSVN